MKLSATARLMLYFLEEEGTLPTQKEMEIELTSAAFAKARKEVFSYFQLVLKSDGVRSNFEDSEKEEKSAGCVCVYCHRFPNGKKYYGISDNPIDRWKEGAGYKDNPAMFAAICTFWLEQYSTHDY